MSCINSLYQCNYTFGIAFNVIIVETIIIVALILLFLSKERIMEYLGRDKE